MEETIKNILIWCISIVAVIVAIALILDSIEIINAGEVGVVYDAGRGILPDTMGIGWHIKTPVLQTIYHIKTARDTINLYGTYEECKREADDCDDIAVQVPSKEGLEIIVDVSVFYKVKPEKAIDVVKGLTTEYVWGTVIPSVRSATRDVAGGMAVTELYGAGREKLEDGIYDNLFEKFDKDGFILEEVLIRDVAIPEQIKNAVEAKQKTEQEMLQKETEVKKEKLEAERKIAQAVGEADAKLKVATAEAESIRIQGQALRENPDVVQLRWVEKWDGKMPVYMLGTGTTPLVSIPAIK